MLKVSKSNKNDYKAIADIQKQIITLLNKYSNKPIFLLVQDNCSELSRLTACWFFEKKPDVKISVLKGVGVRGNKNRCHDILLIEDKNKFYLIDPTIWQFSKSRRSIVIGILDGIKKAISKAGEVYGGKWKISERLSKSICRQKRKLEKVIKLNIIQN